MERIRHLSEKREQLSGLLGDIARLQADFRDCFNFYGDVSDRAEERDFDDIDSKLDNLFGIVEDLIRQSTCKIDAIDKELEEAERNQPEEEDEEEEEEE